VIHPTAIVHPQAQLDPSVCVAPYAVIDEGVVVGPDCVVGPHVYLTGQTTIGRGNIFHAGAVIGDAPQDLKYRGEPASVRIGDGNVFREHVTVNRSAKQGCTVVGSDCFFMANAHIGHDSVVGNHVIIANGAPLGGHAEVHDRAFISGNCLVHQFVRVGAGVMMQGGSAVSKDVPPFTIVRGDNHICGLNVVGLRRSGVTSAQRLELKRLYRLLFRSGQTLRAAMEAALPEFPTGPARQMLDFILAAKRGVCMHDLTHDSSQHDED
jgi:UDP-N-acetylglucosamine acyltransferase